MRQEHYKTSRPEPSTLTGSVSAETRGYDAGKKINGRKRHIVVDTIGLLLLLLLLVTSIQDRDGGRGILKRLHSALASVRRIFADGGYLGPLVATAKSAWGSSWRSSRSPPVSSASRYSLAAG
jgi:Transposase DDE domain